MNMGEKILVVDDKKVNRFILGGIFEDEYQILQAEGGEQAIDIIERERENIAVVLLDIVMPQTDGFAVLDFMKNRGYLKKIPVVLVTMNGSDENINKAYEYEVADFIQKPYQEQIIKKRVNRVIESYKSSVIV